MRWADERALGALRAAVPAPDPAALELYAHILGAEHVWLARLEGRLPSVAVWPTLTLDECERLGRETHAGYDAYLASLAPDDLTRGTTYRNSAGVEFTTPAEDILLHVALHGAYHRGQVARAVRLSGATPAPTDYIAFVRGAPAATRVG